MNKERMECPWCYLVIECEAENPDDDEPEKQRRHSEEGKRLMTDHLEKFHGGSWEDYVRLMNRPADTTETPE